MSDIGLLMTGVLTTGQPSPPQLPQQPVIQLDNGGEESAQNQETNLVPTVQITPPEFMQSDGTIHAAPSALALNQENIFSIITETSQSKGIYSLVKSQDSQVAPEFGLNPTETLLQNGSLLRNTLLKNLSKQSNNGSVQPHMNLRLMLASTSLPDWKTAKENATNVNVNVNSLPELPIIEVFPQQQSLAGTQGSNSKFVAPLKYNDTTLPTLRFGSSGVAVRVLQRLLLSNGYAIRVDGIFGALTEAAVKAFQNQHTLAADGIVGSRNLE